MASKPGVLTDWPWTPLGSFKYVILVPWVVESVYKYATKEEEERDLTNLMTFPIVLWRIVHNQIWITLSRYRTAKANNLIVDKGIEFQQVDRESNWDDHILLSGILFYVLNRILPGASHMPVWRTDGSVMMMLLHAGPVEFLYYWLHRALHHHFLYSRYHSHHHSSIVTEPITSVIHPFAEHLAYYALFSVALVTAIITRTLSIGALIGYITYVDFMNNMGHCNFELIPSCLFSLLPPLKFLIYSPSYHSLHHTQFRTNYSLFMPLYDYIYGTMDQTSDRLYQLSVKREEDKPAVVHLTHLTTPDSIYHLRLGFAQLAAEPEPHSSQRSVWLVRLLRPLTRLWSLVFSWFGFGSFVLERNRFGKLSLQTWVIPKFKLQYMERSQYPSMNKWIEGAVMEADSKGVKVLSLGLLNQGEELNANGAAYLLRYPKLKTRIVDGSGLAAAAVLNSIPKGTTEVVFGGNLTKVAYTVASALCQRDIKVMALRADNHRKLAKSLGSLAEAYLALANGCFPMTWLVGDGLSGEEEMKAQTGTIFIPFSQFPPNKLREDCFYHTTPAMSVPKSIENIDSCENWLPRRVMSAWRVAGIVHAVEGWEHHECGHTTTDLHTVWTAALRRGFEPLLIANPTIC